MSEVFVVRQRYQVGIGIDPLKEFPHRGVRKEQISYLHGKYWCGTLQTANKYDSFEEAKRANDLYGSAVSMGSKTYGHIWPSEVVSLVQAEKEEKDVYGKEN